MKSIKIKILSVLIMFVLFSCANTKVDEGETQATEEMIQCELPRPQICTREYRPVCGFMQDGNHKTFANACEACANINVGGYFKNECK